MKISKSLAVVIAAALFWPLIHTTGVLATFFLVDTNIPVDRSMTLIGSLSTRMSLILVTILVMVMLVALCIGQVRKKEARATDEGVLWLLVLLFGCVVAGPIVLAILNLGHT